MNYLIDTTVISELAQEKPNPHVVDFIAPLPATSLYLSSLTWGELKKVAEKLPVSSKKTCLQTWMDIELRNWFGHRMLAVDVAVSECWGKMLAEINRSVSIIDSLIAATAIYHNCILLTRNTKDFDYPTLHIMNPFLE